MATNTSGEIKTKTDLSTPNNTSKDTLDDKLGYNYDCADWGNPQTPSIFQAM